MSATPKIRGADDEMDLASLLRDVWSSKQWVALFVVVFEFMALFYLANTTRKFQADALIQLEENSGALSLPAALSDFVDQNPRTATEIGIISSRMVLSQVVAKLNLDWVVEARKAPLIGTAIQQYNLPLTALPIFDRYGHKGDEMAMALLEVPPEWVDEPIVLTVGDAGGFSVELPDGRTLQGQVGKMIRDSAKGFAFQVAALNSPAKREFIIRQVSERYAVEQLRLALSVTETGKQSGILQARLTNRDPKLAISILNGIADAYVSQNVNRSSAQAESSLTFIEEQLPQARAAVDSAESALNAYRLQQKSVDLTFETETVLTQINKIQADLAELQVREDDLKQRYKTTHPLYQQLLAQRERLKEQLASLQEQVAELPETQREVLNLTSKLELARKAYTELLTREQEVRVLKASNVGNVRILDHAAANPAPISPRKATTLAVGLLLGLIAGAGFGIGRVWLRKTVQGTEAIEELGLPVFATINQARSLSAPRRGGVEQGILAVQDPTDLSVEGLRSLRTSLQFGMLDAKTRSLAITSTAPGAGKSFTALNLAAVTAQAGQTVCLVDADMRRGHLRKMFGGHKNAPGLSDYLAGEKTLDEVLNRSEVDGLLYIPSGRYPPNPSELLMRRSLTELVEELNTRFDFTLFDCPPVLAVTDPVIIGRAVGGVLAVVRYDSTVVAEIEAMMKTFDSAGLRLMGSILNGYDPKKARAGGYSYNYNYRYEYKKRDE